MTSDEEKIIIDNIDILCIRCEELTQEIVKLRGYIYELESRIDDIMNESEKSQLNSYYGYEMLHDEEVSNNDKRTV